MNTVVYDAAVLVAADRNDRRTWAEHKARLQLGCVLLVPAPVLAQVSRGPRQSQLHRFLAGCTVAPFEEKDAYAVGALLGRSGTADVVDAAVVALAVRSGGIIVTGDPQDIRRLVQAAGREIAVFPA